MCVTAHGGAWQGARLKREKLATVLWDKVPSLDVVEPQARRVMGIVSSSAATWFGRGNLVSSLLEITGEVESFGE